MFLALISNNVNCKSPLYREARFRSRRACATRRARRDRLLIAAEGREWHSDTRSLTASFFEISLARARSTIFGRTGAARRRGTGETHV